MNVQVPTTTLHHRPMQAALAIAGGTVGVLAITSDDGGTTSATPVTSIAPDRVLDGSPILRGTSVSAVSARVLDGSPILRGHAAASAATRTSVPAVSVGVLDGSPILRGHAAANAAPESSSVQGAPRSLGRPQGFGYVP